MNDVLVLFVSLVVILFAAELFTNGIEWFGKKLGLGEGAIGSVLAAVGTAPGRSLSGQAPSRISPSSCLRAAVPEPSSG